MAMSIIALTAGIISGIMGLLMLLIGLKLYNLYQKNPKKEGLYLCLSIFSFIITTWSATIVYLSAGSSLIVAQIFQKSIYTFVFIGIMLTFLFASKIFFTPKKELFVAYIVLGIACILILVAFPTSEVDNFPDSADYPLLLLKLEYGILLVLYILPTAFGIFWIGMKVSKKVDDPISKTSFRYISTAQLMIPLTFTFDTIASLFMNNIYVYSIFLYLTWVPPVVAAYLYDRGYTLPERARKRQSSNKGEED
ncbi:MAG: hypothetical protein GF364_11150 [Candidatus Lokiarchaeota archaeon]|nr:hypothetical protein [Candidatus Lokiarchaeota archaeon]